MQSLNAEKELTEIMGLLNDKGFMVPVIEEKKETPTSPKEPDEVHEQKTHKHSYDPEACKILQLDPKKPITLKQIEEAYKERKQDAIQYKGDNNLARRKEAQLNDAYEKLKSECTLN